MTDYDALEKQLALCGEVKWETGLHRLGMCRKALDAIRQLRQEQKDARELLRQSRDAMDAWANYSGDARWNDAGLIDSFLARTKP